ncbi:hypothetical protein CALVIDRAFT_531315 [Calocera viscosa TUFC12733]|uniref:Uncharacterized protein n=1 Tax=Calocera viscosa (strain TUFC12733) TaxID=1330018 RepID=A0A167GJ99_CALVF|nr:hypothetical protein CALVIDRAFT_531315 [Calocera viscosa TUFC12733]
MSAKRGMPLSRESAGAPKFGASPMAFNRYFEDLERLFAGSDPEVADDTKKIDFAIFYTDDETYELWSRIRSGLSDAEKSDYDGFKQKVKEWYPGAGSDDWKYNRRDLDDIIFRYRGHISTRAVYGQFIREFDNIAQFLIEHKRISSMDRDRLFRDVFYQPRGESPVWDRMDDYLRIKHIDKALDDVLTTEEYMKAAEWALGGTTAILRDSNASHVPESIIPKSITIKSEPISTELTSKYNALDDKVNHLTSMMTSIFSALQSQSSNRPNTHSFTPIGRTPATGANAYPIGSNTASAQPSTSYTPPRPSNFCYFDGASNGMFEMAFLFEMVLSTSCQIGKP